MNYLGVNAIEELVPILDELILLKKDVEQRLSRIATFPLPDCPYDKMTPMFNLAIIGGGTEGEHRAGVNVSSPSTAADIVDEGYEDIVAETEEAIRRGRGEIGSGGPHASASSSSTRRWSAIRSSRRRRRRWRPREQSRVTGTSCSGASADQPISASSSRRSSRRRSRWISGRSGRPTSACSRRADEFVYVEDLVDMTKELVHYMGFSPSGGAPYRWSAPTGTGVQSGVSAIRIRLWGWRRER